VNGTGVGFLLGPAHATEQGDRLIMILLVAEMPRGNVASFRPAAL
jgi:hypothetical protein